MAISARRRFMGNTRRGIAPLVVCQMSVTSRLSCPNSNSQLAITFMLAVTITVLEWCRIGATRTRLPLKVIQTLSWVNIESASPPKADIKRCSGYVSNVPEADLSPNLSVVGETAPWSSSWLPLLSLLL